MHPLEAYIRDISTIRSTGAATPETSYYSSLASLFNDVGRALKPRVRCITNLKNRGAGLPDGGFFTSDQFQKIADTEPLPGQLPSRGAIEIKAPSQDVWLTARGEQVSRYWGQYRQVLVTNLRDFLLIGEDSAGKPVKLESYRLALDEAEFWKQTNHPRRVVMNHGERFTEFLKRVMLHAAPLTAPKDVAWFLASYARDAKVRLQDKKLPALDTLRSALEQALGIRFEEEKGEQFFRSTLIQTIFYGVFSAWVLWAKQELLSKTGTRFNWRETIWYLHVPMIRALYEQLATPTKLGPLDLIEVLNWTESVLNRIDKTTFFSQFEEGQAVQYFYEPFLQAFDPELRKELGVWFTPPEIVRYMVARVDAVLRTELEIPDGLADSRVYILDPCCGTGAFLVEVLRRIEATYKHKFADAGIAHDVKTAALRRIFGFELLPAPFVVAHLQAGLYLQNLGVPLVEGTAERIGIFLTNALTGWKPPEGPKQHLAFPEMEEERDAAEEVKREKPILVILGNPPYNAFAGVSPEEEEGLVAPYKEGLISKWGVKKFNLDDLYIRFLRLAERRIAEMSGSGVICYISNFSYLEDPSFVVMRQSFLNNFERFWFDCMNGDSRETGKLTPGGEPDPSVFSTEYNKAGIRVGTTIGLAVRSGKRKTRKILFRHFWGQSKKTLLVESLGRSDFDNQYEESCPREETWFSFRPSSASAFYYTWPKVTELSVRNPYNGPIERRGNSLIAIPSEATRLQHVRGVPCSQ